MEILTEILTEITSPLNSKGVWGGGDLRGGKREGGESGEDQDLSMRTDYP